MEVLYDYDRRLAKGAVQRRIKDVLNLRKEVATIR